MCGSEEAGTGHRTEPDSGGGTAGGSQVQLRYDARAHPPLLTGYCSLGLDRRLLPPADTHVHLRALNETARLVGLRLARWVEEGITRVEGVEGHNCCSSFVPFLPRRSGLTEPSRCNMPLVFY